MNRKTALSLVFVFCLLLSFAACKGESTPPSSVPAGRIPGGPEVNTDDNANTEDLRIGDSSSAPTEPGADADSAADDWYTVTIINETGRDLKSVYIEHVNARLDGEDRETGIPNGDTVTYVLKETIPQQGSAFHLILSASYYSVKYDTDVQYITEIVDLPIGATVSLTEAIGLNSNHPDIISLIATKVG